MSHSRLPAAGCAVANHSLKRCTNPGSVSGTARGGFVVLRTLKQRRLEEAARSRRRGRGRPTREEQLAGARGRLRGRKPLP
jgi:hypothetical protein